MFAAIFICLVILPWIAFASLRCKSNGDWSREHESDIHITYLKKHKIKPIGDILTYKDKRHIHV